MWRQRLVLLCRFIGHFGNIGIINSRISRHFGQMSKSSSAKGLVRRTSGTQRTFDETKCIFGFFYCLSFSWICWLTFFYFCLFWFVQEDRRSNDPTKHGSSNLRHHETGHLLASSSGLHPKDSSHKAIARKDVPLSNPSSVQNNSAGSSHSNQFEKKDAHSAYASYKNKKELERKAVHSSSHVRPSTSQASQPGSLSQQSSTDSDHNHRHQSKDGRSLGQNNLSSHAMFSQHASLESYQKSGPSSATSKQQQIAMEKQRLIEERSKIRERPNDSLWGENRNSTTNVSQTTNLAAIANTTVVNNSNNNGNGSHQKSHHQSGSGYANQAFYDNLMNEHAGSIYTNSNSNSSGEMKHFKADSVQSNDNEDSLDLLKREPPNELKMEFSDNESNQSPTMNLSSISSLMMPMNGYLDTCAQPRDNGECSENNNAKPVKSKFMSIFTKEESTKPSKDWPTAGKSISSQEKICFFVCVRKWKEMRSLLLLLLLK